MLIEREIQVDFEVKTFSFGIFHVFAFLPCPKPNERMRNNIALHGYMNLRSGTATLSQTLQNKTKIICFPPQSIFRSICVSRCALSLALPSCCVVAITVGAAVAAVVTAAAAVVEM